MAVRRIFIAAWKENGGRGECKSERIRKKIRHREWGGKARSQSIWLLLNSMFWCFFLSPLFFSLSLFPAIVEPYREWLQLVAPRKQKKRQKWCKDKKDKTMTTILLAGPIIYTENKHTTKMFRQEVPCLALFQQAETRRRKSWRYLISLSD